MSRLSWRSASPGSGVDKKKKKNLPFETGWLRRYDRFLARVEAIVAMPDRMIDLLFGFLHQNSGTLSKRARTKEFAALTEEETKRMEEL